jgi:hypothetical protein
MDVFAKGADDALRHRMISDTGWSDRENLGGALDSAPVAVARDASHIDVFVKGNDDALWHKWWPDDNGRWSGWGRQHHVAQIVDRRVE